MNRTHFELIIVLLFLATATLLLNPFNIWMYPFVHGMLLGLFVVLSGAFLMLFSREIAGDERENQHRTHAGRAAFIAGTAVLLTGIILQAFTGTIDPWLIYGLCAMVLAKLIVRVYCAYRN